MSTKGGRKYNTSLSASIFARMSVTSCYKSTYHKRPDPPLSNSGPGLPICTGCAAQMSMNLLRENPSAVSHVHYHHVRISDAG
jgi:hypothetical protein